MNPTTPSFSRNKQAFPWCLQCSLERVGPSNVCFDCVAPVVAMVDLTASCQICSQKVDVLSRQCGNPLCWSHDRKINRIYAIARKTGDLDARIQRYKYSGETRWAPIFGRVVYEWLERNLADDRPHIIVANPTYVGPGGRSFHHTELVLEHAAKNDAAQRWNIDVGSPRLLVKEVLTEQSAGAGRTLRDKRLAAEAHAQVIRLWAPGEILGKRVLVYDDICTTGSQFDAVAGMLLGLGADTVDGLALARAEWRG